MTDIENKYWAFLSYSQSDNHEQRTDATTAANHRRWADWLHGTLKTFAVPTEFIGQPNGRGEIIPERIQPVFQDESESSSGAELSAELRQALERSICLVVICSPHSARSSHVNEVVRYFKQLGRGQNILPIVIAGEPYASEGGKPGLSPEAECFVSALRHPVLPDGTLDLTRRVGRHLFVDARHGADKREILANDHRHAEADLEMARIQLIALVVGVGFNGLWQREQKRHFFDFAEAQVQIQEAQRQVREAQSRILEIQNLPPDVQGQIQEAQNQVLTAQAQAREAQHQLQELQDKVRDTQAQLEEARNRALASDGKFLEAQNLAQAAQNQLEELRSQPRATEDDPGELEALRRQAEEAEAKLLAAESQLAEAHERAIADEDKVRAAETLAREAQDQILELQQRSPAVDSQVAAAQNEAREAQEKLWELQDKIQEAQIQLQEAQQQALADERKVLAAETLAQEAADQLEELRNQNRETSDIQGQLAELRQQAEDAQNKFLTAESQLAEAREQVRAAQSQVLEVQQHAQKQALEAQNLAPDVHHQIQAAQNQVLEAENQARVAQEQLRELQNQVHAAQTELAEARDRALADESKVLAALEQAREAQDQMKAAQNQVRELRHAQGQSTEAHQQAQADAARRLLAAQNEVREFQSQVQSAQSQLEETRQQIRAAQGQVLEAQNQAQAAQEQVRELQNQVQATQAELEAARIRSLADEGKILAAQTLTQETQQQLTAARNQVSEAQAQVLALQSQLREAQVKVQEMESRTRDAHGQIEAAQKEVRKIKDKHRQARRLTQVFAVLAVLGLLSAGMALRQRKVADQTLAAANSTAVGWFDPASVGFDQERIQLVLQNLGGVEQARSLDELAAWIPRSEIPEALKASAALLNDQQRSHFQKWLLIRLGWVNPLAAMTNASAIDGKIVNDVGVGDSPSYFQLAVLDNWMKTDLSGAFNWVCQLSDAETRQRALEKIIPTLVANDPVQAIQQRQQLSNHDQDDAMLCAIMKVWLARQPEAALNWVKSQPDSGSKNAALITCIDELAKTDMAKAMTAAAEALPEGVWRNMVMADLFRDWTARDPQAAAAFAGQQPEFSIEVLGEMPGPWFPTNILSDTTNSPTPIKPAE